MTKFNSETEDRISKALDALPRDGIVNLKAIAREFEVDYQLLRRRFHGCPDQSTKGGTNSRLSQAQDEALCRRIRQQVKFGFPMRKKQVVACAQWILELGSGKKEADLGSHWFARWEKRHPELHEIITKPISNTRKEAAEDYNIK